MNPVTILLLGIGGNYRRRRVHLTPDEPISIKNHRDKQLYLVHGNPIAPHLPSTPMATLNDLLNLPPLKMEAIQERRFAIGEDDNPWLITRTGTPPSEDEQASQLEEAQQEWLQKAFVKAEKKSAFGLGTWINVGPILVASLLGLGILILVAHWALNRGTQPVA